MKKFLALFLLMSFQVNALSLSGDDWKNPLRTKTWTPPAATDTLLGRLSTDTLQNKTMSGSLNTFTNLALTSLVPLTNDKAVISNGSGYLTTSATTATQIGYLSTLTSDVQTQLNAKTTSVLANGSIFIGNVSNVATAQTVSGGATISNTGVVTLGNTAVTGQALTGYVSGAGTVAATDTILQAVQKLNGNTAAKLGDTKGQSEGSTVSTTQLDVPYNQLTTTATGIRLLETGNGNMLVNPSFEGGVTSGVPNGWTCTVGTCTKTTTSGEFSDGVAAMKVVLSAQSMDVSQTVTTPAGIQKQGYVRVLYRMPTSGIVNPNFVITVDGTVQKTVPSTKLIMDGTYRSYDIPISFGSTNVKVGFTSSSSTGTVYFDAISLEQGLPNLANVLVDSNWEVYTPIFTNFGTVASQNFVWRKNGGSIEIRSRFTVQAAPAGLGQISLPPGYTALSTMSVNATPQGFGGRNVNTGNPISVLTLAGESVLKFGDNSSGNNLIVPQNTNEIFSAGDDFGFFASIPVNELKATSSMYAQASSDYGPINAGTITVNTGTKGTVVTDRVMVTKKGSRAIIDYQYEQSTAGSLGSGDYIFTLPTVNGVQLQFDSSIIPYTGTLYSASTSATLAKAYVGTGGIGVSAGSGYAGHSIAYAYSPTQFRIVTSYGNGVGSGGNFSVIGSAGYFTLDIAKVGWGFHIDAPINGWTDTQYIVGSFENMEKCANAYECTDYFTAQVTSAGVVSNESVEWINGNCAVSATSTYDCTLQSYLKDGVNALGSKFNCTITPNQTGYGTQNAPSYDFTNTTVGNVRVRTQNSLSGAALAQDFTLRCDKGPLDSRPKTAKVATSIGVPTVPGIVGTAVGERVDIIDVSYGTTAINTVCSASPCSYLNQFGTGTTSVTRASTGTYTLNLGKTYTNFKCQLEAARSASGLVLKIFPLGGSCTNCSSISFTTYDTGATLADTYGTLSCKGTY